MIRTILGLLIGSFIGWVIGLYITAEFLAPGAEMDRHYKCVVRAERSINPPEEIKKCWK